MIYFLTDCCNKLNVDVSESDYHIGHFTGSYELRSMHNDYPAFKHESSEKWIFFVKDGEGYGDSHWAFEDELGKTQMSGSTLYGKIRYDGTNKCPETVGQQWSHYYAPGKIDETIGINCAGIKIYNETKSYA